jgi:guanylate kinase
LPADFIVTVTTRSRRDYEVDGRDYHFVNQEQFRRMIEQDELLEYARVYGNWYGVPKDQVRQSLDSNRDAVIKVDIQGAATIKKNMPEACFIFVTPPSMADLALRLTSRNSESEAERSLRLDTAGIEMEELPMFDYVVLNHTGELEAAVEDMLAIIKAEKLKTRPRICRC